MLVVLVNGDILCSKFVIPCAPNKFELYMRTKLHQAGATFPTLTFPSDHAIISAELEYGNSKPPTTDGGAASPDGYF